MNQSEHELERPTREIVALKNAITCFEEGGSHFNFLKRELKEREEQRDALIEGLSFHTITEVE